MPAPNEDSTSVPIGYRSAVDWDPRSKDKKYTDAEIRRGMERARRDLALREEALAFEPRTANASMRACTKKDLKPQPLFLDLWHEGELLVLAGPPNSGKSTLAVQLAESIARGHKGSPPYEGGVAPAAGDGVVLSPKTVLLLDLENSDADFTRRYSVLSDSPPGQEGCPEGRGGRSARRSRVIKYNFSDKLNRPEIDLEDIPRIFNNDREHYLRNSFGKLIDALEPAVIVIDNLTLLTNPTERGHAKLRIWLRDLRHLAHQNGISILLTYPVLNSPPRQEGWTGSAGRGGGRPFRLTRAEQRLLSPADVILALNHSTFGEDHRYLKVIRSSQTPRLDRRGALGEGGVVDALESHDQVHVLRLERSLAPSSPPCAGVPAGASPRGVSAGGVAEGRGGSSPSSLVTSHSSPETTPRLDRRGAGEAGGVVDAPAPFLGFTFLGVSFESDHLTDHTLAALLTQRLALIRFLAAQGLPASVIEALVGPDGKKKPKSLVDGLMDGSYARYIKSQF